MFSTDKNVNTIAELLLNGKKYAEMRMENAERRMVRKLTAVLTGLIMGAIILLVLMIAVIFLSAAATKALAPHLGGEAMAALTVGMFHLAFLILVCIKRKAWISTPLSNVLSIIFLGEKASQAAPEAEKIAELERTIAAEYRSLTEPQKPANNNMERALNAASRAWTIADGLILGYKLYRKFSGKRKRRSRW